MDFASFLLHCVISEAVFLKLQLLMLDYPFPLIDVHPYSVCQKLGPKYASIPVGELNKNNDFYQDLLRYLRIFMLKTQFKELEHS